MSLMAQKERDVINERLLNLKENERMFRANCGMAWTGEFVRKGNMLIIKNARAFHGLPEGFPDLIGWETIEITPDMIGQKIAVFTAEEIKTGAQKIKRGSRQAGFRDLIIRMGGIHRTI